MSEIYLMVRYTPFWSIPIMLISLEFSYIFWVRKKQKAVVGFLTAAFITFLFTGAYYIIGGPEKSVKFAMKITWYLTR